MTHTAGPSASRHVQRQAKDTAEKPGTNDDWRLSVKKGRDGKDGALRPPLPETVRALGLAAKEPKGDT